eukprot:gene24794-26713_t
MAVIDLKGFTRAGEFLGRSQPAISLQIKRLQEHVGFPLFGKDGSGSSLTDYGRVVEAYARRILALNDELVSKIAERNDLGRIRIGMPPEFADVLLGELLVDGCALNAGLRLEAHCDCSVKLREGLSEGAFDLIFAVDKDLVGDGLASRWTESISWIGRPDLVGDPHKPLRLVTFYDGCPYRDAMLTALMRDGRAYEIVCISRSVACIKAAVAAGFGISALPTRSLQQGDFRLDGTGALPQLPSLHGGIYLAGNLSGPGAGPLAAHFAKILTRSQLKAA